MNRAVLTVALFSLLVAAGCSDEEGGDGATIKFHGEQGFLKGFSHDTGYQPAASPIQVRLELASGGAITADAQGSVSGGQLTPHAGTGVFSLAGQVGVKASLKVSLAGKKFEGPIPNAPDIQLKFGGKATFDPFLIRGKRVPLAVKVPMTQLVKIPLAGALSTIPGVKGDLTISASGDLKSEFMGGCVKVSGGVAHYTGQTLTSGTLTIKPVVEVSIPLLGSKKLDTLSVTVPIKQIISDLDLGAFNASDGSKAATKPCSEAKPDGGAGKDKGPGNDGPAGDGPASDGPAAQKDGQVTNPDGQVTNPDKGGGCKKDSDCVHLKNTGAKGTCTLGVCVMDCTGDYYDVNGKTSDGCEWLDPYAKYTSEATAFASKAMSDCDKDKILAMNLLSDDRYHVKTKGFLPNGTVRYFKVPINDKLCVLSAKVKFDLSKLPKGNTYKVETRYVCKSGVSTAYSGGALKGGGTKTITPQPSIPCPGTDDSGTLYMKAQKTAGGFHSENALLMTITP